MNSEMRTACPTPGRETPHFRWFPVHCVSPTVSEIPPGFTLNVKMYIKPESFLLSFISPLNIFNKCFSDSCSSLRTPSYKFPAEEREANKAFEQTVQVLVYSLGCWLSAKEGRNLGCSWLIYWIMDTFSSPKKLKQRKDMEINMRVSKGWSPRSSSTW